MDLDVYACHDLSLNRGVVLTREADAFIFTSRDLRCLRIGAPNRVTKVALAQLESGFLTLEAAARIQECQAPSEIFSFHAVFERLCLMGWLAYSVLSAGKPLLTVFPLAGARLLKKSFAHEAKYVLSRFVYLRRHEEEFMLTSPLSGFEGVIHCPAVAALIANLATPSNIDQIEFGDSDKKAVRDCLTLLLRMGAIGECMADSRPAEDSDEQLLQWEFHDLIYHLRAREGFHNYRTGGTFRFSGRITPEPAIRAADSSNLIQMPEPKNTLGQSDGHLFSVLDRRRSLREHGERRIKLTELSEFLFRSARVTSFHSTTSGDVGTRPYPSGGGIHELELYIVISRCDGLAQGIYRYRPFEHCLENTNIPPSSAEPLLTDAAFASMLTGSPDILIVVAARFQRLSWKYEGIAYSLLLKHVGCLIQTMYLVATAMDLAPCAIGSGNSNLFARIIGSNPYLEPSVGEFILGSRASDV